MLKITNLSAGYADVPVLKNVSLEIQRGTITILMGPNGAGKSTLLKSIFNTTQITEGTVAFEGENITGLPAYELLSKGIAFVSQGKINFSTLNVEENLRLGAHTVKNKTEVDARIAKIYEQFPALKEKRNQLAFALSGGQQQMLAIGRALMSAPKLLLLDEPSLGLSPKLVREVFEHIKNIKEKFNTTVIIVEHNLKSLLDIADYGYVLVQGEVVAHDSCATLKNSPIMKQVFVGAFE